MKTEPIFKPGDRVYWVLDGRRCVLCLNCGGSGIGCGEADTTPGDPCLMCGGKGYIMISEPNAYKIIGTVVGLEDGVSFNHSNMYYVMSDPVYCYGAEEQLIYEGLLHPEIDDAP